MKKKRKKALHLIWIIPLLLLFIVLFLRMINSRQIDDIHPNIPCEEEYIQKSKILWVIPNFKGIPINESKDWCNYILSLNKTLGLHGINHEYKEFSEKNFTEEELLNSMLIFEDCFGYKPLIFKPPQLHINWGNKKLVEKHLELYWIKNQIIHKVYHCDNDTNDKEFGGIFPNKFHDLF